MGKGEVWQPANPKPLNQSSPNLIRKVEDNYYPFQILTQSVQGFSSPYTRNILRLVRVFTALFDLSWMFQSPTANMHAWILTLHTTKWRSSAQGNPFWWLDKMPRYL